VLTKDQGKEYHACMAAPRELRQLRIRSHAPLQGRHCPQGDACPYAHNIYEYWLHPNRFRTTMCKEGLSCTR
jgi:hypothetical protein